MLRSIFQKGSTTYFFSSLFFPHHTRREITQLYAFVRTADNYVDRIPQDIQGFLTFKTQTLQALATGTSSNPIIHSFAQLYHRKKLKKEWVMAFFTSMQTDTYKHAYKTYKELQGYMYGSAEVIGLMIACILKLPKEAYPYAQKLAEAMQLINIIRDVAEDAGLGRVYIPQEDLKRFQLKTIDSSTPQFARLIRYQINRYLSIQKEAEKGYRYLPKHYRIAIKTAADMYHWVAMRLYQNPSLIFKTKLKPSKSRIIMQGVYNTLFA